MKKKKHKIDNTKIKQRIHFKERLFERYNVLINRSERMDILDEIKNNNYKTLFHSKSDKRKIIEIEIKERLIPVVYDYKNHSLITALKWKYLNNVYTIYERDFDKTLEFIFSDLPNGFIDYYKICENN